MTPIYILLVFITLQFATALGLQWAWPRLTGQPDLTAGYYIASTTLSSLLTIAVLVWRKWSPVSREYVRRRPWGQLAWAGAMAAGLYLPAMRMSDFMPELPNTVLRQMTMIMSDDLGYLVIGILAPVAEEMAFRGGILRLLLKRWPKRAWAGIAVSALLFALVHGNPAQMPYAFLAGGLLGWMYLRTGSIAPTIAFHWVNNTIGYLMFRAYPDPDLRLDQLMPGNSCNAAVAFSLLILIPAAYQFWALTRRQLR